MADKKILNALLPHLVREGGRLERGKRRGEDERLYWILHRKLKKAFGPYDAETLSALPNFRRKAMVAPYGSLRSSDWRRADAYPELLPYLIEREKKDAEES